MPPTQSPWGARGRSSRGCRRKKAGRPRRCWSRAGGGRRRHCCQRATAYPAAREKETEATRASGRSSVRRLVAPAPRPLRTHHGVQQRRVRRPQGQRQQRLPRRGEVLEQVPRGRRRHGAVAHRRERVRGEREPGQRPRCEGGGVRRGGSPPPRHGDAAPIGRQLQVGWRATRAASGRLQTCPGGVFWGNLPRGRSPEGQYASNAGAPSKWRPPPSRGAPRTRATPHPPPPA
jgi:hypothetical protein